MIITFEDAKLSALSNNYGKCLQTLGKNEWACDLDQPFRLIFRIEIETKTVKIREIVDYH